MTANVDAIFPEEYQPIVTIKVKTKPELFSSQYGGGLDHVLIKGSNQIAREYSVRYELPTGDADFIDNFLSDSLLFQGWFWWTADYVTGPEVKIRCEQWKKTLIAHNWSSIDATFVETFDFAQRKRGLIVYSPSSYLVTPIASSYTKGFFLAAERPSFQITLQNIDLTRGYGLYGEPVSYSIVGVNAGPEFFDPLVAIPSSYAIALQDAGLSFNVSEDYFGNVSLQMYGWQADYYVEWWGN
jgi:phage-related protein